VYIFITQSKYIWGFKLPRNTVQIHEFQVRKGRRERGREDRREEGAAWPSSFAVFTPISPASLPPSLPSFPPTLFQYLFSHIGTDSDKYSVAIGLTAFFALWFFTSLRKVRSRRREGATY
jgi:hypothetical protein